MNYNDAKKLVYATGTKTALFDNREDVAFAFDPNTGKTLIVARCGYYNSGLPPCVDASESCWLIDNHPHHKHIYNITNNDLDYL